MDNNSTIKLENILNAVLQDGTALKGWVGNLQGFLGNLSTTPTKLKEKFQQIIDENVAYNDFSTSISENNTTKDQSLYNYIIKVYYDDPNKLSYKDLENINSEVSKILESVYGDESTDEITDILDTDNEDPYLAKEFLCINGILPKMITDDIGYYSNLLNNSPNFKKFLIELRKRTINYN